MPVDMALWRLVVTDRVRFLADEAGQRTAWYCQGPWNTGPRDELDLFFDSAAALAFLADSGNGLSEGQASALSLLATMLGRLRDGIDTPVQAATLIGDRRWRAVCRQARTTLRALRETPDAAPQISYAGGPSPRRRRQTRFNAPAARNSRVPAQAARG